MKILSLIPAARIGGAEKMMLSIIKALINEGHEVILGIGSEVGGNREITRRAKYLLGGDRARNSVVKSVRIARQERPDIIFLNLGYINLAIILKLFYPRGIIIARIGNTISAEIKSMLPTGLLRLMLIRIACYFCDKIVVQSEIMKKDIVQCANVDKDKIYVLQNIIADDHMQKCRDANPIHLDKYIFCAASCKRQKRVDLLITACREVMSQDESMHLVVAGANQKDIDEANMLTDVNSNIRYRMHFLGQIENIMPIIRDSTVCVSSSDYEGSSNYLIEAKSIKKFCVVTDCPGSNSEIFENYKDVIFVQPGSAKDLAEGIRSALSIALSEELIEYKEYESFWEKNRKEWVIQLNGIFK